DGGDRGRGRGRGQKSPTRDGDAHGHGNPPIARRRRGRRPIITERGRLCDTVDFASRTAVARGRLLNSVFLNATQRSDGVSFGVICPVVRRSASLVARL